MKALAKFNPHNPQEFENDMRALIVSHMGLGQGNPTQWVVNAVCEAFQRGFGVGFNAGTMARTPAPTNSPSGTLLLNDILFPADEKIHGRTNPTPPPDITDINPKE